MSPCTTFLYTRITFSSRIASFVSSAVMEASTSLACSSSPGRKAPACVMSRDMLGRRKPSVLSVRAQRNSRKRLEAPVEYSTGFALAQLDSIASTILKALLVGAAHSGTSRRSAPLAFSRPALPAA
eukprot:scaffold27416_cov63-Phaeocystis_antarctica.AAC.3